jgi:hypothetical protein
MRGHFGYVIAEHKKIHYPWAPDPLAKDPINNGMLYGKYVAKDLNFFYCPSIPDSLKMDPNYGMPSFFIGGDSALYVTWGGYMYAAPVATRECPRADGKHVYPPEVWHDYFIDTWLKQQKGYGDDYKDYVIRMPRMQALLSDEVIGGAGGQTLVRATHGNGLNVLYSDYHAKFVQNGPTELKSGGQPVQLFDLNPTSGPGGALHLYAMWEYLTRRY